MTNLLPPPATDVSARTIAAATGDRPARGNRGDRVWWRHLIGLLALAFALFPIVFLVSAALNPVGTLSTTSLLPNGLSLSNFAKLLSDPNAPYLRWYGNTLLICGASALLNVLISASGAFAFSRLRFRGRRAGLITVLLVQMFPNFIAVVALYLVFIQIGSVFPAAGLNTSLGLILVYLGGAMGVNTWLLKGYLDTIPRELDQSAFIDGATAAQVFFRITLPLAAPMLVVVGLFSFVANLNEILLANVFLTDTSQKTLAIGLFGLVSGEHNTDYGEFAAGSLLAGVPVVLIFLYLQKFLAKGLTAGAVKGLPSRSPAHLVMLSRMRDRRRRRGWEVIGPGTVVIGPGTGQWQWRDLFEGLLDYQGDDWASEIIGPWAQQHPDVIAELHAIGAPGNHRARVTWRRGEYSALEGLYALGRVLDVLAAPYQPVNQDPALLSWINGRPWWTGRIPGQGALPAFAAAVGAARIGEEKFHPFFHEITAVEPADDPDAPVELITEVWPGYLVGNLLARAGVIVRAGPAVLDPEVAARAPHRRRRSSAGAGFARARWLFRTGGVRRSLHLASSGKKDRSCITPGSLS